MSEAPPTEAVFGLFGAGGFAREVMPLARQAFQAIVRDRRLTRTAVYFVDQAVQAPDHFGIPVLSEEDFLALRAETKFFNIAIANGAIRKALAEKVRAMRLEPLSLIAPSVTFYDENVIGEGVILCANATVTTNARIGRYCHLNLYSYVAHDCVIGDYVTFAPRVNCNGNVHIGDNAYIGTGAVIREGAPGKPLRIGEGAVVGMGAVVTRDVPPNTTVVGNPARVLEGKT